MAVHERSWKKNGKQMNAWVVDVTLARPGEKATRITRTSPVNTKRGAEQFEAQIRTSYMTGQWHHEKAEAEMKATPTLSDFWPKLMLQAGNKNRIAEVRNKTKHWVHHLEASFGSKALDSITPEDVEAFKQQKRDVDQLSPKTINNLLGSLRRALRYAVACKVVSEDAIPKIEPLTVPHQETATLEPEEVARVIAKVPEQYRCMVITAIGTGARIGELLAAKWSDFDLKTGFWVIRHSRSIYNEIGPTKNGLTRRVKLPGPAVDALRAHRNRGVVVPMDMDAWVFTDAGGAHLTHRLTRHVVTRACRAAGLSKELGWHGLRHTAATLMVAGGTSLRDVMETLGHQDVKMVFRYAHATPTGQSRGAEVLGQVLGESPRSMGAANG